MNSNFHAIQPNGHFQPRQSINATLLPDFQGVHISRAGRAGLEQGRVRLGRHLHDGSADQDKSPGGLGGALPRRVPPRERPHVRHAQPLCGRGIPAGGNPEFDQINKQTTINKN